MYSSSEPAFFDRQDIIIDGPLTTVSTDFVPIPGAEVITVDLGSPGNYQVEFSMSLQQSNNNTSITFRAVIDGIPGKGRSVFFGPGSSNEPQHATLIGQADSINANTLFILEWKVSGGTGQLNGARMVIDGVPSIRVIPFTGLNFVLTEAGDQVLTEAGDELIIE